MNFYAKKVNMIAVKKLKIKNNIPANWNKKSLQKIFDGQKFAEIFCTTKNEISNIYRD
jgi:hypothetical protein